MLPAPGGVRERLEPLAVDVLPAHHAAAPGALVEPGERGVDLADLAPGLEHEDFTEQSLYALLETRHGVRLTRGRRSVEAVAATGDTARALAVETGEPLLLLRSTSWSGERPVEVFVALHRGDRSRFEVDLERGTDVHAAAVGPRATTLEEVGP